MDAADQEIRFCSVDGSRVAYATVGEGPLLVLPALWIGHLELEWEFEKFRGFIAALARERTVVRYDRLGTGLSDRDVSSTRRSSLDTELATLEQLISTLGARELSLLGISLGGCAAVAFAARHPDWVRSVALFGAFAHGSDIGPAPLRDALVATVRAHWGAGARALSDIWLPGADAQTRTQFTMLQRAAATADVAADLLAEVYRADVRDLAPEVRPPTVVVHRRRDRAIPFAAGRALASLLPNAQLVALDGDIHLPWLGKSTAVVEALRSFYETHDPSGPPGESASPLAPAADDPLTARELEVLRLVARGLSDNEIAAQLTVSPHTVHRHVANIRSKLGQPSRAAAAAHAARLGII